MNSILLILTIVSGTGISVTQIPFNTISACNKNIPELIRVFELGGYPGHANGGIKVKAVCINTRE